VIDRAYALPMTQQCQPLALARSSVYAVPQPIAAEEFEPDQQRRSSTILQEGIGN